jgi:hypothetical protein
MIVNIVAATLYVTSCATDMLHAVSSHEKNPNLMLHMQAPSFSLDEYLTKLQQGATSSSNPQLAANIHAAVTALQEAVEAARQQLDSMQKLADECIASALAVPLQDQQDVAAGEPWIVIRLVEPFA